MGLDPLSGVEIELLLEGTDRIALGYALAEALEGRAELGTTYTKVPIPPPPRSIPRKSVPGVLIRFIDEAAARHQAKVWRVAPDSTAVYLEHRSIAVHDADGLVCTLVHDTTLDGGERVCEIVTAPLHAEGLRRRLEQILGWLHSNARYTFGPAAATHVHLEHRHLTTPAQLARLIAAYHREEPALRTLLRTPPGLLRAKVLPPEVVRWQPKSDDWGAARKALGRSIRDKDHALNLLNLLTEVPEKPTVELKIGAASDDSAFVMGMRDRFVALIVKRLPEDPIPRHARTDGTMSVRMAMTIPPKLAAPQELSTTSSSSVAAAAKPAARDSAVAVSGGTDAGRAAASRLSPGRSAPLNAAFTPSPAGVSATEDIVVTGKPENRWYSGWDQSRDKAWVKTAVTPAELKRISDYGMTRTQYNALLTNLYRPQSEQNLALRFNKYEEPRWPKIQAAMTPAERQQAASGQMSPADATRILMRAEPAYAWMGTPAPTFTPVTWFPARDSAE